MTRKVFKFPLPISDVVDVPMPNGAVILDIQPQGPRGALMLWALVDPTAPMQTRRVMIAGTGHPIDDDVRHISTFQLQGVALVFHAFEVLADAGVPQRELGKDGQA